jgi:DNA-binding response OmpR family regulator
MRILVTDPDRVTADVVAYALQREGYQVIQAHDGISALQCWSLEKPDLLILEVDLPGLDGFSLCQRIRQQADTPILFLSARCTDADVVQGLELGADAYLAKPFSPRQLVARVQALMRRSSPASRHSPSTPQVWLQTPHLTPLERRLYEFLLRNPGQVQTCDAIMDYVWGEQGGERSSLRQLIHRLRDKIEVDPDHPTCIKTVSRIGYTLAGPATAEGFSAPVQ